MSLRITQSRDMTASPDHVRITCPADLVEIVPYLLGFHPSSSVVLVGFAPPAGRRVDARADSRVAAAAPAGHHVRPGRVQVAVRADLPPHGGRPEIADLTRCVEAVVRGGGTSVVALLYPTDEAIEGGIPSASRGIAGVDGGLRQVLVDAGVEMLDLLVVTPTRWRSNLCDDVDCCPATGLARLGGASAAAAQAVLAGLVAHPSRGELDAAFDGCDRATRAALVPLIDDASGRWRRTLAAQGPTVARAAESEALRAACEQAGASRDPGSVLTGERLARCAVALSDPGVRDTIWLLIDENSLECEAALRVLACRLPSPWDAPALFLFGWGSWRRGNGALAGMAAARAIDSDPAYAAPRLLLHAIEQAMDPRRTPLLSAS